MSDECVFLPIARLTVAPVGAVGVDGQTWTVSPLSSGGALVAGPYTAGTTTHVVVTWPDGTVETLNVHARECVTPPTTAPVVPGAVSSTAAPVPASSVTTATPASTVGEPSAATVAADAGTVERERSFVSSSGVMLAALIAIALIVGGWRRVRARSTAPPLHRRAGGIAARRDDTVTAGMVEPVSRITRPDVIYNPSQFGEATITELADPPTRLDPDDPASRAYAADLAAWLDDATDEVGPQDR